MLESQNRRKCEAFKFPHELSHAKAGPRAEP
jgi:hypothetical protein